MKKTESTQSVRINQEIAKDIKVFVTRKGGSIKRLLEYGAKWAMTDGKAQYVESVEKVK